MKYVDMRLELIDHLKSLSDLEYQQNCWVKNQCPEGVEFDEFDNPVHFFFDDTELAEDPKALIGWILKDEREATCIERLTAAWNRVFDKYGFDLTDKQYISTNEWKEVIEEAKSTLVVLMIED